MTPIPGTIHGRRIVADVLGKPGSRRYEPHVLGDTLGLFHTSDSCCWLRNTLDGDSQPSNAATSVFYSHRINEKQSLRSDGVEPIRRMSIESMEGEPILQTAVETIGCGRGIQQALRSGA